MTLRKAIFSAISIAFALLYRPAFGEVVINEIMYNPSDDQGPDDDYEYIELHNTGAEAVNLSGWAFTEGIYFTFPTYVLPAGDYVVVCKNSAQVAAYYGISNTIGDFEGRLENAGEKITLVDASPTPLVIDEVDYRDELPWPSVPDGRGPSLELINPSSDNGASRTGGRVFLNRLLARPASKTRSTIRLPTIPTWSSTKSCITPFLRSKKRSSSRFSTSAARKSLLPDGGLWGRRVSVLSRRRRFFPENTSSLQPMRNGWSVAIRG